MMYYPTRHKLYRTDPMLSDVINEAMREGRSVELKLGDGHGYLVVVDGVEIANVASESFDWPLKRIEMSREAEEFATECIEKKHRRRIQRRKDKLSTKNHSAAEGLEVSPI